MDIDITTIIESRQFLVFFSDVSNDNKLTAAIGEVSDCCLFLLYVCVCVLLNDFIWRLEFQSSSIHYP
jgi:hypothetical protein